MGASEATSTPAATGQQFIRWVIGENLPGGPGRSAARRAAARRFSPIEPEVCGNIRLTFIPIESYSYRMSRPNRRSDPEYSGLMQDILLYFPTRYRPQDMEKVLRAVAPWLEGGKLQCRFERIRPDRANFERLADMKLGQHLPVTLRVDGPRALQEVRRRYLHSANGRLAKDGRPLTILTFIDPENTTTIGVHFHLRPGEESFASWSVALAKVPGEASLVEVLDEVDPFWATITVESPAVTLTGILEYGEHLPDCGYWGSRLISVLGENEVLDALNGCPKVSQLPSGGMFVCWGWETFEKTQAPRYAAKKANLEKGLADKVKKGLRF